MEDWTEKYRPISLDDVVGNERAITELRSWAESWKGDSFPKTRAVILSGKPGTGKTSSALALARNYKWTPIELNASDARNATTIHRVATSGAMHQTFDMSGEFSHTKQGGRKLIILDEADNLYERIDKADTTVDFSDRGGKRAIIDTIRMTRQPIILIVNDYYQLIKGSGDTLKQLCKLISFYPVATGHIIELLKEVCRSEQIAADVRLLQSLADRNKGDVRSALNDLQSICFNRNRVDSNALDALGYRDRKRIIFDALRDLFKTTHISSLRENMRQVDIAPDLLLLWVTENLPREFRDYGDIARGFEAVSKSDIFFGRVHRRQYYGLWSYACDMMQAGVATAKTHTYANSRYYPPLFLKQMGQSKQRRAVRDTALKKMGSLVHTSQRKTKDTLLSYFRFLFSHEMRFASEMHERLKLSEAEMKFLLDESSQGKVKDILQYSERSEERKMDVQKAEKEDKASSEDVSDDQEIKQPSLFDF